MLTNIGLSLIIIAWVFQLVVFIRNTKVLSLNFVALYSLGVLLLVIDSYNSGLTTLSNFNFISLIASLSVLVVGLIKNKKG